MTLQDLIIELNNKANILRKKGISPNDIRVVIQHDGRECTGDISDVSEFINIQLDDIPYDTMGMDYTGSEVIKIHDNVVIIRGDY